MRLRSESFSRCAPRSQRRLHWLTRFFCGTATKTQAFVWVERFSQQTTDAIKGRDFIKAEAHLKLLSRLLASGDEATIRCIDVAYVESLIWDVKDEKLKKHGWSLIPANLRSLYIGMWGEKSFMKGAV
jgi:hypothetical protein